MSTIDATMRGEMARLWGEFRRRGFDRPATGRVLLTWAYNLGLTFAGLAAWFVFDSWWLKAAGLLVSSVGFTGVVTCGHTAAHGTALPWRWANTALAYFGYPFMVMLSVHYWRNKHNYVHHPAPNVIGTDDDCDLMPFFAMNESEVQSAGPLRRFYYLHVQGWLFPIALTMNGFNVQRVGWTFLVKRLLDRRTRRPAHFIDLGVLLAHVGVWIVLPCVVLGVAEGLILYVLRIGFMGYAMFFAFAPAHFPAEADLLEPASGARDFVLRQTQATVNFRTGVLGRLACNGVEYQIEHHLFPGICDVHYARIAPLVREVCERNGYPYRTFGWAEGIWKSWVAIFHPRPIRRIVEPPDPRPAPESATPVPA